MKEEFYFQTPEEMIDNMCGLCWEYAELARFWFSKRNFEYKVFFVWFLKKQIKIYPRIHF